MCANACNTPSVVWTWCVYIHTSTSNNIDWISVNVPFLQVRFQALIEPSMDQFQDNLPETILMILKYRGCHHLKRTASTIVTLRTEASHTCCSRRLLRRCSSFNWFFRSEAWGVAVSDAELDCVYMHDMYVFLIMYLYFLIPPYVNIVYSKSVTSITSITL